MNGARSPHRAGRHDAAKPSLASILADATSQWRGPQALISASVIAGLILTAGWLALMVDVSPWLRLTGIGVGLLVSVVAPLIYGTRQGLDVAPVLAVPIILSAVQNLLLLPLAPFASPGHLRLLLSINLAAAALILILAGWNERHRLLHFRGAWPVSGGVSVGVLLMVAVYTLISPILLDTPFAATLASARNLMSVPVFLLLGILAARVATVHRYCLVLVTLGWAVVAFGLFERFHPTFWQDADLASLWLKKGISVATYGLPYNFFSSEQINGAQVRRMVSSFADPVNLGTFLFVVFLAAWYLRRRLSAVMALAGCLLAISKGALVGVLVFCLVAAWFYLPRRALWAVASVCGLVAVAFLMYSLTNSTGSVQAHVGGFLTAFRELPGAPMGHGVGQSGVLAQLLTKDGGLASTAVESGVGVVVGQLGLPGIAAFGALFGAIALDLRKVRDVRSTVLAWGLLLGFASNAAFNEVALSPNSSGPFFLVLGLLIGGIATSAPIEPRPALITRTWSRATWAKAVLVVIALSLLSLSSTLAVTSRFEATVNVEVFSGRELVAQRNQQGKTVFRRRPSLQDWQRLESARVYADLATTSEVTAQAAADAGLTVGSEILRRGQATAVPQLARITFTAEDRDPVSATRIVSAWAEATTQTVHNQEEARSPGREPRNYTRLAASQVEVRELPLTASTVARHSVVGVLSAVGLAWVWWLVWPRRRRDPARASLPVVGDEAARAGS